MNQQQRLLIDVLAVFIRDNSMKNTVIASLLLSLFSVLPSIPAYAGIWNVLDSLRGAESIIRQTGSTVNSLRDLLDLGISEDQAEEIEDINDLYRVWFDNLAQDEKEWVSYLLTEFASGNSTRLSDLTGSDWYRAKDYQEQQRVNQLYFDLQKIVDKVEDHNSFYAYAFCINGGSRNCE